MLCSDDGRIEVVFYVNSQPQVHVTLCVKDDVGGSSFTWEKRASVDLSMVRHLSLACMC